MKRKNYFSHVLPLIIIMLVSACSLDSSVSKDELNKGKSQSIKFEGVVLTKPGVNTQIEMFNQKVDVLDIGDAYVWQSDILLNKEDVAKANSEALTKGAAVNNRAWPAATVYYRIRAGLANQQRITDAINMVHNAIPRVTFVRSNSARNYIEFVDGGGSTYSDWIGYKGGRQIIGLAYWATSGNTAHEILHALGVFHEQCRTDRDNSIIVNYNNIAPDWRSQYYTFTQLGYNGFNNGPFDFNSIMLYPSDNSYNGQWSMTTLDGRPFNAQRDNLSAGDISVVNALYPPAI